MKLFRPAIMTLLAALALSGCGTTEEPGRAQDSLLTPFPGNPDDPPDALAYAAIGDFLKKTKAPQVSGYDFSRSDLNGDGLREALFMMNTPYGYWCGTYGCSVLIFCAYKDKFEFVSAIQPVREPVFISAEKTNGWNNIVIRVSGRRSEAKNVAVRFDGRKYPENPENQPEDFNFDPNHDVRIFQRYY